MIAKKLNSFKGHLSILKAVRGLTIGCTIFFLLSCGSNSSSVIETQDHFIDPSPKTNPNVLLIVADDMGFTDLGSFGGEIPTPNLDALAERGLRLANFHSAPVCAPARAMLMSGMDNHEAGIASMDIKRAFDNGKVPPKDIPGYGQPGYEGYLSPRVVSLPEAFRVNGYQTFMTGKWDLGRAIVEEHNPVGRGFDRSFTQLTGTAIHFPMDDLIADGGIARADPFVFRENWEIIKTLPEDYFSSDYFTDKMMSYLNDRDSSKPFFAYLSYTAPHFPIQAPDIWIEKFESEYDRGYNQVMWSRLQKAIAKGVFSDALSLDGYESKAPHWEELSDDKRAYLARMMEIYAAMVANMDHNIGRLIGQLDKSGDLDNTIILFMSDNGAAEKFPPKMAAPYNNEFENLGKQGSFAGYERGWAEASTGPLRDVKGSLAEGGIRVPAILTMPMNKSGGEVSKSYITVQDVMPSLLDLAGIEHPDKSFRGGPRLPIRGKSFAKLLNSPEARIHNIDEPIGWEFEGQRALVKGDHKILWSENGWMLFNLAADPGERRDLASENVELVDQLVSDWYEYASSVGVVNVKGEL